MGVTTEHKKELFRDFFTTTLKNTPNISLPKYFCCMRKSKDLCRKLCKDLKSKWPTYYSKIIRSLTLYGFGV